MWNRTVIGAVMIGAWLAGASDTLGVESRTVRAGGAPAAGQESAQTCFQNGLQASQRKDLRNAVLFFGKAIERDPGYAEAYRQRALAYLGLGGKAGFESAEADASKAIELEPANKAVYVSRGKAYMGQASPAQASRDRPEAARARKERASGGCRSRRGPSRSDFP
ncbi:MAG TPA: hypothetical protein VLN41_01435 [Candidatus Bathyarchaeia archaeon]|nr:hypothetical protein [Candidatus Bathyarchaeia archaeon]